MRLIVITLTTIVMDRLNWCHKLSGAATLTSLYKHGETDHVAQLVSCSCEQANRSLGCHRPLIYHPGRLIYLVPGNGFPSIVPLLCVGHLGGIPIHRRLK